MKNLSWFTASGTPGARLSREDRLIGWGLFALAFIALFASERAVGFVRDESVYFAAGESYARWFRALFASPAAAMTDASIVRFWDINHEHPVLMKTLFGLSHLLFHEALGWLRPAAAFRVPAFATAALIPALLYWFGAGLYGRAVGVFAAVIFFLVPRQYFNSQLSAFDVPIAAMWLFTVYAFWRAQTSLRWGVLTGVAFGLAIATKHNALFLPFVLTPFALVASWQRSAESADARKRLLQLVGLFAAVAVAYALLAVILGRAFQAKFLLISPHTLFFLALAVVGTWLMRELQRASVATARAALPVLAMAVLGPVIFYFHWPYLWHAPVDRTAWYLAFHATHNHYSWFYLGDLLREPPFPLAYVLVKTALTVPTSLFIPMVTGFVALLGRALLGVFKPEWVRRASWSEVLVLVNASASILIISHPQVPHFGGVKHWFPSMIFLSLLAGVSVVRGAGLLAERLPRLHRGAAMIALSLLLMIPAAIASVRIHPYGTSYYSELAGGLPGAASLGMQRQFWSNNVTGVLPWINEHAPRGARLYLHEVNGYSFRDYQKNGMLRADLRPVGNPYGADVAAYQYHQEFREHEFNIWEAFGTTKPVHGLYVDETPQVVVYTRAQR